jgi:hypothetical protein
MINLEESLASAFFGGEHDVGLACIDARSGILLASAQRLGDLALTDALSSAAACTAELATTPPIDDRPAPSDETMIVGARWVQVLVRAPAAPDVVVLGMAEAGANLGLLLSCARNVAKSVGT